MSTNTGVAPAWEIARAVAEHAEKCRSAVARAWLGEELPAWETRCPIRVKLTQGEAGGLTSFGFSHGIFPVIVNTLAGMRNVNRLMVTGATAMGATRVQLVRYVIFPHMVATVFAGLRLAMTLTLLGVVLAEIFVSQGGIGFYTLAYSETFNPAALMALVLTLALMAIALNELVRLVETRFSRWKD